MSARNWVSICLLVWPVLAIAEPPICENPAALPADLAALQFAHGAIWADFDSTYLFIASVETIQGQQVGTLHRYRLNGSEHLAVPMPFFPTDIATNTATRRLYLTEDDLGDDPAIAHVYDFDLNELPPLFTGEPDPAPNGKAGWTHNVTVQPGTGDLYVLSHGPYFDPGTQESSWISRIQRFDASGNFDGLVIENALPLSPGDPGYDQPNPSIPDCGEWHYPWELWVTAGGEIYLHEAVNGSASMRVVHKFSPAGQCLGVTDVTNKEFAVDRDGYIYTSSGNTLTKFDQSWSQVLYTAPLAAPDPIIGIALTSHTTEFALIATDPPGGGPAVDLHLLGPRVESLAIINRSWQNTTFPYHLRTSDVPALAACDSTMSVMEGVVADGVGPLLLRWKVPGPGQVRWELEDPSYPSIQSLLGTLANLDSSAVDTVTIDTGVEKVDGEYFAFAVYAAPKNFDRKEVGADPNAATRSVAVVSRYFPTGFQNPDLAVAREIGVERPPVLFVHGLWSDERAWNEFPSIIPGSLWRTYQLDYADENGRGLDHHLSVGTISRGVLNTRAKVDTSTTVCAQVDVVMHSLGGVLARDFAASQAYKSPANYGEGDFNKLLFLNTSHNGTPIADAAVRLRSVLANPFNPLTVYFGIAKRVSSLVGLDGITATFATRLEQLIGDALDDLQTDSGALASLPELAVPIHSHVGDASAFWSILTPDFQRAICIAEAPQAVWAWTNANNLNLDIFPDPSDLTVPTESQIGGLAVSYYDEVGALCESIHSEATSSAYAGSLATEWIRRRPDDVTFFAPSIPAPTIPSAPGFQLTTEDVFAALPNFAGRILTLTITDPPGGGTTFPGKVIRVRLQGPMFASDSVTVFYPGGALAQTYGGVSGVNGVPITVPLEFTGAFDLAAVGVLDDGRLASSAHVTVLVDPGAKSPPLTVTDVHVEPSLIVLSGRGATERLRVIADYSDGVEREISSTNLGTSYVPSGPAFWQVNADGVMVAKAPGVFTLTVTHAGHSVDVPVTVLNGPQINNAPHADAGGLTPRVTARSCFSTDWGHTTSTKHSAAR